MSNPNDNIYINHDEIENEFQFYEEIYINTRNVLMSKFKNSLSEKPFHNSELKRLLFKFFSINSISLQNESNLNNNNNHDIITSDISLDIDNEKLLFVQSNFNFLNFFQKIKNAYNVLVNLFNIVTA